MSEVRYKLREGISEFQVRARDSVGIWGPVARLKIGVDKTPPQVVNFGATIYKSSGTWRVQVGADSVIDDKSGVDWSATYVQYRPASAESWSPYVYLENSSLGYVFDTGLSHIEEDYEARMRVKDNAGNEAFYNALVGISSVVVQKS